ncbi:hypothetical protein BDC45DRAFT_502287 [Circinella umbellata]|nr:hypothetical protein BDC45DRAFT_502287 [Circinella umbellata]
MYEFQPPQNINAIRCSIARRIKDQREKYKKEEELKNKTRLSTLAATVTTATTDNGLPSPPVEACHYEPFKRPEEEEQDHPNNELAANALLELSGAGTPPSSSASVDSTNTQTHLLDEKIIRQKIQELQQEKHELFQLMKNLLSRPTPSPTSVAVVATPEQPQPRSPHTPSPQVAPRVLPTPPSLQQTRASKPPPVQTKQHLTERPKSRERLRSCSNGRARTPPTSLPSATSCTSPTSRPPAIRTAPPTDHYHHHRFPPPRYAPYRRMSPPSSSRYYSRSYGNSTNNSNGSSSNSRLYSNPPLSAPPFPPSSSSSSMPYAHRRIPLPYGSLRAQSPPLRSNFRPSRPMADRHIPRY